MAKIIVYRCDTCNAPLSDPTEKIAKQHLSIDFNYHSGWVIQAHKQCWSHCSEISGIHHFCGPDCLKNKFEEMREKPANARE